MPEPAPEPELQASADLSPVSPSPVHTAPSVAVPVLQDTVDTIDAMVAAVFAQQEDPSIDPSLADQDASHDDVVDDDSFSGDYAQDSEKPEQSLPEQQPQPEDPADDYAKTFDSDMDAESGGVEQPAPEQQISGQTNPAAPTTQPSTTESQPERTTDHLKDGESQESNASSQAKGDTAIDIQRLMSELASQSAQRKSESETSAAQESMAPEVKNAATPALPSPSTLPPRPPVPSDPQAYKPENYHPGQPTSHVAGPAGGPGPQGKRNSMSNPQKPAPNPQNHLAQQYPPAAQPSPGFPNYKNQSHMPYEDDYKRQWDQFVVDERQYMTEAKWDRFPEGSRIFIGNLTSEPVDKRDIFDVFHKFGRIAQISLKSAYGFVQYHTPDEGRAAIDHLEGAEIKGRRIHLEISKLQDKSKKDRARSPAGGRRESGRGGFGPDSRQNNRHNDGSGNYRNNRGDESRRSNDFHGRNDQYSQGRNSYGGGRDRRRSRSPSDYGRDMYRRRSPSPPQLPPKRYGPDVPDVQLVLLPGIYQDSVRWVEEEFQSKGLKKSVITLPGWEAKDHFIRHFAQEGVLGVVEIDNQVMRKGLIPLQVFKPGGSFDKYEDIRPDQAAQLVYNAKPQQHQQPPAQPNTAALAGLLAQADPATLQQMMAALQQGGQQGAPPPGPPHAGYSAPPAQPDLQSVLASLGGSGQYGAPQPPTHQQQFAPQYGGYQPQPPQSGGDTAALQNIMAQLNRRA